MKPHPTNSRRRFTAVSHRFLVAGAVVAAAVAATATQLPDSPTRPVMTSDVVRDPVVAKALSHFARLSREGNWNAAAEVLEAQLVSANPDVLLELGKLFIRGWGVERNPDKAREHLLRAVQSDFPRRGEVAYELGKLFRGLSGPDCNRIAFEWFSRSVEWGYAKAHREIAFQHARGIGVPVDYDKALQHYRRAAASGLSASLVSFAAIVARGSPGMDPDLRRAKQIVAEAVPLLLTEARADKASAAKALGRLYRDGVFVRPDRQLAFKWLQAAARLGDAGGAHDLAFLMLDRLPPETARQEHRIAQALGILRKAAAAGHGGSMTALGRFHLKSRYGLSPELAPDWFRRGADAGHAGSMEELARLKAAGKLVGLDHRAAVQLARRGAVLGHKGSRTLLKELLVEKPEKPSQHPKKEG